MIDKKGKKAMGNLKQKLNKYRNPTSINGTIYYNVPENVLDNLDKDKWEYPKNGGFVIDFFELMFLAESVIPDKPIARSMCFDDFSEIHYHKMNENQRLQFFEHVQNCNGFTLENEQCGHFFARFNPKNQYLVSYFHNGKADEIVCYMFEEEYRTQKNIFVNRDYIKSVVRIHDSQTMI